LLASTAASVWATLWPKAPGPAPDVAILNQVTRPSRTGDGQHATALRFGDARVMALMAATAGFSHLVAGFGNRELVARMRALLTEH
jgi:hypothetical protein